MRSCSKPLPASHSLSVGPVGATLNRIKYPLKGCMGIVELISGDCRAFNRPYFNIWSSSVHFCGSMVLLFASRVAEQRRTSPATSVSTFMSARSSGCLLITFFNILSSGMHGPLSPLGSLLPQTEKSIWRTSFCLSIARVSDVTSAISFRKI